MQAQHSLISHREARSTGMTEAEIRGRVRTGNWIRVHAGIYASAAGAVTPERDLLAACMAAGPCSAASHLSAAWWLGLTDPPKSPVLTVPYRLAIRLAGVTVHRSRDLDLSRVLERGGVRYTDPLRILTDLAGELVPVRLVTIIDKALSTRLVTTDGLHREIERRRARGRKGPKQLLAILHDRGLGPGPAASVLEARAMRLFRRCGIPVIGREVRAGSDGRYRIDFLIAPGLAVEVDGFAYHWSPEAKAYDDTRRNRLRADGITVLVYDWRAIQFEERRVAQEIHAALVRLAS